MSDKDLRQRTLEKIDGEGDKLGRQELGRRSPITRAVRAPAKADDAPAPLSPAELSAAAQAVLRANSTDLHAKDKKGRPIPTLHERIRAEGVKAQMPRTVARAKREAAAREKNLKPKPKRKRADGRSTDRAPGTIARRLKQPGG